MPSDSTTDAVSGDVAGDREQQLKASREAWLKAAEARQHKRRELADKAHRRAMEEMAKTKSQRM